MYRGYFNLKENPFTTSPDPRFFYLAPGHAESMAKCEYAIRNKSGLAVVYGDVGTTKTTMLNKLRQRFGDKQISIAVLNNPNQISDTTQFKVVVNEFGLISPCTKQGLLTNLKNS
jgi:general secretion pathway protein A